MRPIRIAALAAAAVALLACPSAFAAGSGKGGIGLKKVGRFEQPTYVAKAPGEKGVFVVEQPGRVRLLRKGKKKTFLDIRGQVLSGGEQGLLSIAFPSDYQQSGFLYVFYVANSGDLAIEEYRRASATKADAGSARRVLTVNHPGESNHNGGQLQFGPDGFLYIGTGDGGGAGDPDDSAQNTGSLLGKILRIDVDARTGDKAYGIPSDNPFANDRNAKPEIWASGLRNPWRCSFDTAGGELFCGDVQQNSYETIKIVGKGQNMGWRRVEGMMRCFDYLKPDDHPAQCDKSGITPAILEYNNCTAKPQGCMGISVTGGYVYRGAHAACVFFVPSGHALRVSRETSAHLPMQNRLKIASNHSST